MTLKKSEIEKLKLNCIEARNLSYSPYSKYKVGCTIYMTLQNGEELFINGANVENASYGGTICAERCATLKAVTDPNPEVRNHANWTAIAIIGGNGDEIITPCGICRQFLREFIRLDLPIVMFNYDGSKNKVSSLNELLPMSFGPDSL